MGLTVHSRCLAFHGPLLYEAKIVKVYNPTTRTEKYKASASEGSGDIEVKATDIPDELAKQPAYYVHYKGWKSTWDEWVGEDRVLMWNEENIKTQKELKQAALASMSSKSKGGKSGGPFIIATGGPGSGLLETVTPSSSGTKRKSELTKEESGSLYRGQKRRITDHEIEKEEDFIKRPEITLIVPDVLKAKLVDDWEYVTKDHQLVSLPRKPNVVDILKKYRDEAPKKKPGSAEADIFDEILSGLKLYFDRCLGNILLYRFERQQYLEIKKANPTKSMSELYGAEHLLRLFVSLPGLIAQTNMDQQSIGYLKDSLEEFLTFMVKHEDDLFLKEYQHTSTRYEALAKGM